MESRERMIITKKIDSLCERISDILRRGHFTRSHTGDQKYGFITIQGITLPPSIIEIYNFHPEEKFPFQKGYKIFELRRLDAIVPVVTQPISYLDQKFERCYPMMDDDLKFHEQMISKLSEIIVSMTDSKVHPFYPGDLSNK